MRYSLDVRKHDPGLKTNWPEQQGFKSPARAHWPLRMDGFGLLLLLQWLLLCPGSISQTTEFITHNNIPCIIKTYSQKLNINYDLGGIYNNNATGKLWSPLCTGQPNEISKSHNEWQKWFWSKLPLVKCSQCNFLL